MTANVTIELIENSMRGGPPRKYSNQTVRIEHEAPTKLVSVDQVKSVGNHPSTVEWIGGAAANFVGVTDVKITDSTGAVLVDAPLCVHYYAPREGQRGVTFQVLKDD
jgi:hypothetical protein